MQDRELLELAAQSVSGVSSDGLGGCYDMERDKPWNPLTDDGDALRLAVKLGLAIYPAGTGTGCAIEGEETGQHVMHNGDPYAATRRAIVRAAAALGSQSNAALNGGS